MNFFIKNLVIALFLFQPIRAADAKQDDWYVGKPYDYSDWTIYNNYPQNNQSIKWITFDYPSYVSIYANFPAQVKGGYENFPKALRSERFKEITRVKVENAGLDVMEIMDFRGGLSDLNDFLAEFYEASLIDDYIIDQLQGYQTKRGLAFNDFHSTPEKLIKRIEKQFPEGATPKQFEEATFAVLAKIERPSRRQTILLGIVKNLLGRAPIEKPLIQKFLAEITDSSLPFFPEAKRKLAEIDYSVEAVGSSNRERTKKAIATLLSGGNDPHTKEQLNFHVKSLMYGNDASRSLPAELQNLSQTAESIIVLLEYIQQLQKN